MKYGSIYIICLAILTALLFPMAVSASGVFYCSAAVSSGGDGSYDDPWACQTEAQLDDVIGMVCNEFNGGHLYAIYNGYYDYYKIEKANDTCNVVYYIRYQGYPPDTGPDLTTSLILSGVALAGGAFLVAGIAMRRKRAAQ